ncbi:efflux ABC transporter, permease domain containing protein [Entamoeba histolytica HM-1:IMSS-B]|uniref:ABC3 transporter permease C-terminal domain-containing protein n=6 Tax=Entamoeba histolytica TaxID=5759 RepID=C4LT38_ENTH1|nr:hypothetical protein, conserved [Entamoeba histolytica HM-1:IMSS]EMD48534.1 efflux ABC transporter permease domain containing protein [Entamoeba histolytica KU27]EMH77855.1 efflux ABC transporter, permease domain containing protein [Entamoeba histolytica HM-1:IMSS-B]EMS17817.1 efflux ABC transporter, permease domain containing protein [Entamoeba histolytica HM-3:IMSS]ENY60979.1 efflux ABC transporter, permease domain containing protein [Entamoeba histolytica HM-1:IMSS-A]GAT91707.1 hypotheti|eukprot:XP_657470.1 hypothetical protein, conserved [Entamoeba histolytica HM-1:IMSS]
MRIVGGWFTAYNGLLSAVHYVLSSFRKNKKSLFVGVFTVFVSVCFLYILQNVVELVPAVFMRISEIQVGEGDILLQPRESIFLNYTQISEKLDKNCKTCKNNYPRWLMWGSVVNGNQTVDGILNVYNSELEEKNNIGRGWKYDPLEKDQFVISGGAARKIGLQVGQEVHIVVSLPEIVRYLGLNMEDILPDLIGVEQNVNIPIPLKFIDPNNTQNGKYIITQLYEIEKILNQTGENIFTSLYINGIDMYVTEAFNLYVLDKSSPDPYNKFIIENNAILVSVGLNINYSDPELLASMTSIRKMIIKGIAESPGGKYSNLIGNVISIDQREAEILLKKIFENIISYEIKKVTDKLKQYHIPTTIILNLINNLFGRFEFDLNAQTTQIYVQMKDRNKAYFDGDKLMKKIIVETTDEIAQILGLKSSITLTAPLSIVVSVFNYLMYLLKEIFNFIVIVFAFMGGLLIYSLLITDVESKTYEFGMLRALGLLKSLLIEILVVESTTFSIIGVVIGLILGYSLSLIANFLITSLADLPMTYTPSWKSIVIPLLIGFIVPLISNIIPIKKALSKTLRNSLDLYHSTVNEVNVTIKKIKSIGVRPSLIIISLVMIIASFITYYVIPMSLLQMKLDILFICFLLVLLSFLAGLCLLSQIIQPFIQNLITYIIITPFQSATQSIVLKNLNSHSPRNKKTALMLTVVISFILFAGAVFSLSESTIINEVKLTSGADIRVKTSNSLNVTQLENYLKNEPKVIDYSFETSPISDIAGKKSSTYISNLAMCPMDSVKYIAVDEHFVNTVYNELLTPVKADPIIKYNKINGVPDVLTSLYDFPRVRTSDLPQCFPLNKNIINKQKIPDTSYFYNNYTDVIIAEGIREEDSIHIADNVRIKIVSNSHSLFYLGKVRATIKSMPGQRFSSFYTVASKSPIIISIPQMKEILQTQQSLFNTSSDITYPILYVKVQPGSSEYVTQNIRTLVYDIKAVVTDTSSSVKSIQSSIGILQVFFVIVSLIALLLCFFVMLLSFTSNVYENSWEFAVLRALGLSSIKMVLIYIYEALCITFSSIILGSLIGIGVASLVNLQFILFLQLPYTFSFPWLNAIIIYVISIVVSITSSFIPSWGLTRKPISNVLKGQL